MKKHVIEKNHQKHKDLHNQAFNKLIYISKGEYTVNHLRDIRGILEKLFNDKKWEAWEFLASDGALSGGWDKENALGRMHYLSDRFSCGWRFIQLFEILDFLEKECEK